MKAAVLGSPISHSLSPVLHNAAYRELGLPHTYEAIEINESNFVDFINKIDESWLGVSLTMPLKEVAFEVANQVSKVATQTKSINTLIFGEQIKADNTDVYGIAQSLREAGSGKPKSATILGAGATARSAIVALAGLGVEEVIVIARNQIKSATCIDIGNELGISLDATHDPSDMLFATDVVISTTPQGVSDVYVDYIDSARGYLLDVVYQPWPTKLVSAWQSKSLKVVPGYEMLLHQAVRQVELMTGQIPDIQNMRTALLNALN